LHDKKLKDGMSGGLYGFKIIDSFAMRDKIQFRFPRSKKKRIRKKWAKQNKNYKFIPKQEMLIMGNQIICHPIIAQQIRDVVEEKLNKVNVYRG